MAEQTFIPFENEKTAAEYDSLIVVDQWVEIPVQEPGCSCTAFRGAISTVGPCAAKRYVQQGGNLIKAKTVAPQDGGTET